MRMPLTPTQELRNKLRKLLNESIPDGGTETDTKFLDLEIDDLLEESENVYEAASKGWTIKAGMLTAQIESYSSGQEEYDLTSLKDQLAHAFAMSEKYERMAQKPTNSGSFIFSVTPPQVM
jgi:hypothetical protein